MAHKVHFAYWLYQGVWYYDFIGESLVPIGHHRKTRNPDDIRAIAARGGGLPNLEARNMLEYGLRAGKGGLYLRLTDAQYKALEK